MKPRSDSKLDALPEERKAKLSDWLLSGLPYHQVQALVHEQFKVSTSLSALCSFYQHFCAAELLARRKRAVTTADDIAEEARNQPGKFDEATIDALKQKAFELSINPGADPRDVKNLFMLVLRARDQDLQERDVQIRLRRLEMMEQELAATREKLSKEQGGGVDPKRLADEIDRILGRKS